MPLVKLGATVFAIVAGAALVWASEADEIRERADAMRRQAAQLAEHGLKNKAAELMQKVQAMLAEAERLELHRQDRRSAESAELEKQLEQLRQEERQLRIVGDQKERHADVQREIARVETELRERSQPRPLQHDQAVAPDEIARRLGHMRAAADHLHHAGLHEVADRVAEQANAVERELQERRAHPEADVMHEITRQLDELRREVGRLRDDVNELKRAR